jgi:hypothetical protein
VQSTRIDPGLGEVGSAASSRVVKPTTTTTYTLTATGCGGTVTQTAIVTVLTVGIPQWPPLLPTATPIMVVPVWPLPTPMPPDKIIDLAVSNIYADPNEVIWYTVKNVGTVGLMLGYQGYSCPAEITYIDGSVSNPEAFGQIAVNLDPGQTVNYSTYPTYWVDASMKSIKVHCCLIPPVVGDANTGNDCFGPVQLK